MNYRHEARLRLDAAKGELLSGEDARLKYAALDLRMAMEAITYDRALAYKEEFPPDEYQTWQPRKVMSVLLEIDSSADTDRALAIGAESEYGVRAPVMHSLGSEQVLNMSTLRKHYDALGSYLHLPSMKQMKAGGAIDTDRLRQRCDELVGVIDAVLSSPIFNVTLGEFARFVCARCERPIRKRLSRDEDELTAECFECHATYNVARLPSGQYRVEPKRHEVSCAAERCVGTITLWEADLQVGKYWMCGACGGRNVVALGLHFEPPPGGRVASPTA
jgi:hypothetical protein